jgi:hypothetical protein
MSLLRSLCRNMALFVFCVALLLAGEVRATCEDGDVQTCSDNGCKGSRTCEGTYWGPCVFSGASAVSCSVCGRGGTMLCTAGTSADNGGGVLIPGSCSAYRSELCNGCDDDGDGLVDENPSNSGPLTNGTCSSSVGCPGTSTCVNGAFQCVYQVGARRSCANDFGGPRLNPWATDDRLGVMHSTSSIPAER